MYKTQANTSIDISIQCSTEIQYILANPALSPLFIAAFNSYERALPCVCKTSRFLKRKCLKWKGCFAWRKFEYFPSIAFINTDNKIDISIMHPMVKANHVMAMKKKQATAKTFHVFGLLVKNDAKAHAFYWIKVLLVQI